MTAPFVISMKFASDASGATAATGEIRQELTRLGQTLDASRVKAVELQSTLATRVNANISVRDDFGSAARAADVEAYGRELDALRARYNPLYAAEQRHQANLAAIRQAHRVGAISVKEQADAIRLEEAAYRQSVASIAGNTEALERNQAVRASMGAGSFATANIAAQFQDIAVTSAMGMSPLQIALQQGTQISAVFGPMGAAGAVKALGAAFLSIISPVSLLTIGLVAGAAAAIQYFSGLGQGAESADERLDRHLERIKALAAGYDESAEAAEDYIERSRRRPEGSVASDLETERQSALERVEQALDTIAAKQAEIGVDIISWQSARTLHADLIEAAQGLDQLGISATSTQSEIDAVHTRLTELANDPSAPEQARQYARDLLSMVNELRTAQAEVGSLGASLESLPSDIRVRIRIDAERFNDALSGLQDVVPDGRNRFEVMRAENEALFSQASAAAVSYGALNTAIERYDANLRGIAALEAEEAQKQAERASRQVSAYDSQIASIRDRTEAQKVEANVIGLGTFAVEKARATLELENAARRDAIGLTPQRIAQIHAEASAYAAAAAAQEQVTERQREQQEQLDFNRSTWRSFITEMAGGLREGESVWEALGNAGVSALDRIADRYLSMAADGIFDFFLSAIVGGLTGGGLTPKPVTNIGFGSYGSFDTGGWTGGQRGRVAGQVHGEEFVVRAGPAAANRALLETINAGGSVSGASFAPTFVNSFTVAGGTADIPAYQRILDQRDEALLMQVQQLFASYVANPMRRIA